MKEANILPGFAPLASRYDALICDLWGVLHDGVTAFPHALACLTALRERGKKIVILSNAPRRAAEVEARMNELGITANLYDEVVSSGEEAWRALKERSDGAHRALGRRCFHLGPDRDSGDSGMRAGLPYDFVEDLDQADFLLNTGAHMPEHTSATYRPQLEQAAARRLTMVCANPDLEVLRGGVREICAGMLALDYEGLGGQVIYHGKPHPGVYRRCFAKLDGLDKSRIVAVGDSLRTDVAGAGAAAIDSAFIIGGIHAESLAVREGEEPAAEKLTQLYAQAKLIPTVALPLFRW
jgi:HAD superfamily hydrolase (TIGR01459 family)